MTVEEDVRAVSAAWDAALIRNDAPLVASFMTDDWVYVGPTGATPKTDVIGWIASGRLAHRTMTVVGGERVVVLAADAVLLTARKVSSGTWDGAAYTADTPSAADGRPAPQSRQGRATAGQNARGVQPRAATVAEPMPRRSRGRAGRRIAARR